MGIEFLSLLVPILALVVLVVFWGKKLRWWEPLLLLGVPALLVLGLKEAVRESVVWSEEFWTSPTTVAEYYEDWDEEVSCFHYIYCTDGKNTYICGTQHPYDVDYHPPYWRLVGGSGEMFYVDRNKFEELAWRWKSRAFVNLHRNYHSKNGNKYAASWDGRFETIEALSSIHHYRNKVKVSEASVFNFRKIDPKKTKVFDYYRPGGGYDYTGTYIYGGGSEKDQNLLRRWNAKLGASKKVMMMVLLYPGGTMQQAIDQESYWKGGNKNELALCIGPDKDGRIAWTYVISWTPQKELKVRVAREVKEMETLDLGKVIDYLGQTVEGTPGHVRRNFDEFNYLSVPLPPAGVWACFILAFLVSGGFVFIDVKMRGSRCLR